MGEMRQVIAISCIVGLFSFTGSLCAFAIMYREYARHNLDRGKAFRESANIAVVAFFLLGTLTMIVYALLMRTL